jgi:hypothetical protein
MRLRALLLCGLILAVLFTAVPSVRAAAPPATTPGWECVPTTAGQAVVSGGTGTAPTCSAGSTAVLAPTYVKSGVGNKPTVQLSAVNLQVIDGTGATAQVNGTGNVVIGYSSNNDNYSRTGSHNLILGNQNGWNSYSDLIAGSTNRALAPFAAVLGYSNTASGQYASVTGGQTNTASGSAASVSGGQENVASESGGSVVGGCANQTGVSANSHNVSCPATGTNADNLIAGGAFNAVQGFGNGLLAGNDDVVTASYAAAVGGQSSQTEGDYAAAVGGYTSLADGDAAVAVGGSSADVSGSGAVAVGGFGNKATGNSAATLGGAGDTASGDESIVAGGTGAQATNDEAAAVGGQDNVAHGEYSVIAGGLYNETDYEDDVILGGCANYTGGSTGGAGFSSQCQPDVGVRTLIGNTITGGLDNIAAGTFATGEGGNSNDVTGNYGALEAGGYGNTSDGNSTTMLGGNADTEADNNGTKVSTQSFAPNP